MHNLQTTIQTNCKQKSILKNKGTWKIHQCRKVIIKKWLAKWNDLDYIPKGVGYYEQHHYHYSYIGQTNNSFLKRNSNEV